MAGSYDVVTICNALMDVVIDVKEEDIKAHKLKKGSMHLFDEHQQQAVLNHLKGKEQTIELGGSALNTIRALSILGNDTMFGGMVGEDTFGRKIQSRMNELSISYKMMTSDSYPTGTCLVLVTPDGERTMLTNLGASCQFGDDVTPEEAIKSTKYFHFSGYQWSTPHQKQTVLKAIEVAKEHGAKISFDAADPFVVKAYQSEFRDVIENYADIVFANEEEAKLLFDKGVKEALNEIHELGAMAVIKIGAKGALVKAENSYIEVPAVPTTVVDTTGAGDFFAAGFLHGLCNGLNLEDCGYIAAKLASDVISRHGVTLSDTTRKEILAS